MFGLWELHLWEGLGVQCHLDDSEWIMGLCFGISKQTTLLLLTDGLPKILPRCQQQVLEMEPSQPREPWQGPNSRLRLPGEHRFPGIQTCGPCTCVYWGGGGGLTCMTLAAYGRTIWFRHVLAPCPTQQCPHDLYRVIFDVGLGSGEFLWLPRGHRASL